jgi:hypothetical protein
MGQINPFIGSILQTPQAQRTAAEQRDDRVKRLQQLRRHAARSTDGDTDLEQVANADALDPSPDALHREHQSPHKPKPAAPRPHDEGGDDAGDAPRLDVTA